VTGYVRAALAAYARQLAGLAGLELGKDWLRAVCWDNPVAMFGLPEAVGGG
jgi:hypothetical protein